MLAFPPGVGGMTAMGHVFSFSGRLSRAGFWETLIGLISADVILLIGIAAINTFAPNTLPPGVGDLFVAFVGLINIWVLLAAMAKRLHDRGKSGLFILIAVIPILGWLWLLVETLLLGGERRKNRHGRSPLGHGAVAAYEEPPVAPIESRPEPAPAAHHEPGHDDGHGAWVAPALGAAAVGAAAAAYAHEHHDDPVADGHDGHDDAHPFDDHGHSAAPYSFGATAHDAVDHAGESVHDAAHSAGEHLHDAGHAASEHLHDARESVVEHAHDAGHAVSEHVHDAHDAVSEHAHDAGHAVSEHVHDAADAARETAHDVHHAAVEHAHDAHEAVTEHVHDAHAAASEAVHDVTHDHGGHDHDAHDHRRP